MSKFYLEDYKGDAFAGSVTVAVGATVRLPDIDCKFVKLARWNASDDGAFTVAGAGFLNTNDEIYYGFAEVIFGQLFVSQTTDLLPVSNLKQIQLRVPAKAAAAATVHYVYFK